MASLKIPEKLKNHYQLQQATQEKQKQEYYENFSFHLLNVYETLFQNLATLNFFSFCPNGLTESFSSEIQLSRFHNLFTEKKISVSLPKKNIENEKVFDIGGTFKFIEILIVFTIASLKTFSSHPKKFYEHFGETFKTTHEEIVLRGKTSFEDLDVKIQNTIRNNVKNSIANFFSYFYSTLRPVEIRWMILQPKKFCALIDEKNLNSKVIEYNLSFFRNTTDLELTFLALLDELSWNNFLTALISPLHHKIFDTYHVFGISAFAYINQLPLNSFKNDDPMEKIFQYLSPFLINKKELKNELIHITSVQKVCAGELLHQKGNLLRPFLEVQLLTPEVEFVSEMIESLASYYKNDVLILGNFDLTINYVSLWNYIILQENFQQKWLMLKKYVNHGIHEQKHIQHSYWKEISIIESKKPHQEAAAYVEQAYQFQKNMHEKDWYPAYYSSWSYFVVAWVIVVAIFVLFVVALASYSQHKTHHIRVYIANLPTKTQSH